MNVKTFIPAAPALVWHLLTDTEQWPHWGPSVRQVRCPTRLIGPDSQGQVQTPLGFWLPFTVTSFQEKDHWHWRIGRLPATGHRLISLGETACLLIFEIPLWAAPYAIICKIAALRIKRLCRETS